MRLALFIPPLVWGLAMSVASARAEDLTSSAFLQMPSRFLTNELSLSSRGLGEICYSRELMADGTVCNPAFSDATPSNFLMGRIFLGNGYTALTAANNMLFSPISREYLQDLFRKNNVTSLEGAAALLFATKYFSASFTPYRVQYFSEVHNPNYPVIALQASVERQFMLQGGASLDRVLPPEFKGLSVGAKMRVIDRTYVRGSFEFARTLVEPPRTLLPVKQQYAFYLDPVVGYRREIDKWRLISSVGVQNLGKVSNEDPAYRSLVDMVAGVGVEPPLPYGRLRVGLDMVDIFNHGAEPLSVFRLGGSYKLGVLEALTGWNTHAITAGMMFGFEIIQAGVIYEFMRSELTGGFSENRISTELSVQL